MKFLICKILILSYLCYFVMSLNMNKDESTTLFEMFGKIKKNQQFSNINNFSFKEKNKKLRTHKKILAPVDPSKNKPDEKNQNSKGSNYIVDLNTSILEDWFTVQSEYFLSSKFPSVQSDVGNASVKIGNTERINESFYTASKAEGAPDNKFFWFKLKNGYIYYFSSKNDINALDAILIKRIQDIDLPQLSNTLLPTCLMIFDFSDNKFQICTTSLDMKLKWLCSIQTFLKVETDERCVPQEKREKIPQPIIKKDYKHVIIIPTASRNCNEKWNYANKGTDWECTCKEGIMQSPIDLPAKEAAVGTSLTPMFTYELVKADAEESTIDGLVEANKKISIMYEKGAIRIFHPNMGKIVGIDGSVYVAEEIVFHTPSEHKINGQQFDLEMQVIHYGRSKGDIANQVVLSILFKNSPGHYNKFLDKIDFFNLPNPEEKVISLNHDFFIPSVFLDTDQDDVISMEPFSFYNYEGSLTAPPCTERTTYYVTADPVPLSNTIIELFKEALSRPSKVRTDGNGNVMDVSVDYNVNENNREIQPENGRQIFLFDHIMNGCITYIPPKRNVQKAGHYEKVVRNADQYIFVNGKKPTGIPGAFVVSEEEAYGKTVDVANN